MADTSLILTDSETPSGQFNSADTAIHSGSLALGGSLASTGVANPSSSVTLLDFAVLVGYIRRVVPALLEEDGVILPSFREMLLLDSTLERLKRFISEPHVRAILIQRQVVKGKV